jgi:hypothetical protein
VHAGCSYAAGKHDSVGIDTIHVCGVVGEAVTSGVGVGFAC